MHTAHDKEVEFSNADEEGGEEEEPVGDLPIEPDEEDILFAGG